MNTLAAANRKLKQNLYLAFNDDINEMPVEQLVGQAVKRYHVASGVTENGQRTWNHQPAAFSIFPLSIVYSWHEETIKLREMSSTLHEGFIVQSEVPTGLLEKMTNFKSFIWSWRNSCYVLQVDIREDTSKTTLECAIISGYWLNEKVII